MSHVALTRAWRSVVVFLVLGVVALSTSGCYAPDVTSGGFACVAQCPSGLRCVAGICIDAPAQSPIPKTGAPYSGPREATSLTSALACPDRDLEPNDRATDATELASLGANLTPGQPVPVLTNLAVCPVGVGDLDYFIVRNPSGAFQGLTLDLSYSLRRGDLDVGVFDESGTLVAYDGSIADNARVVSSITPGTYFIVVSGASPEDVGPYELKIATSQGPTSQP